MAVENRKSIAELPTSEARFIGKAINRVEDPMLVTGRAEFIDNISLPGMVHCAMLRSPHAHARIHSIDVAAAEKLPGVLGVITGEEVAAQTIPLPSFPEQWGGHCLAVGKVRFAGQAVAAVAAISRYLAEDALESIEVEYEPLPAVMDPVKAMQPDSPLLYEEKNSNVIFNRLFQWGDVDAAFRDADHVVTETFRWNRLGANPIETFGVISQWDPVDHSLTCRGSFQAPGQFATVMAMVLQMQSNKVRLIAQPHGGSFGGKGNVAGSVIASLLSRKVGGRPVKWIEDRMEYLQAGGGQAWDRRYQGWLAVKDDGTVTGLKVALIDDIGCSAENFAAVGAVKPLASFTGCYTISAASYDLTIVATNKVPSSAYRGMGPPPHNWVLEHLMDLAARRIGMDTAEIRRRNFIPADAFPYTIPSGNEYDSGNYEAVLDKALAMADYERLRREQAEAREQGRHLGIGVVSTIEPGVFDWNAYAMMGLTATGVPEGVTVSIDMFGKITVRVGFAMEGQGQYTIATQLLADYFGTRLEDVRVVPMDTLSAPPHFGPGGSRLGVSLTGAVLGAADLLRDKLLAVAARSMQCDPAQMELMDGMIRIKGVPGAEMLVAQVVAIMLARSDLLPPEMDPRPEATYVWTAAGRTQADDQGRAKSYLTAANACHVVLLEVDPETGKVEILKYWIADDCGTRLNPANVEGMIQGGVAQGVGAALLEEYVFDDDGQLLTSTFMDYLLPTIHEVPMTEKAAMDTPSPFSPLGAKGIGEGAIHTTPAAILCGINDALHPLGVRATEVPASPNRIWTLIRASRRSA